MQYAIRGKRAKYVMRTKYVGKFRLRNRTIASQNVTTGCKKRECPAVERFSSDMLCLIVKRRWWIYDTRTSGDDAETHHARTRLAVVQFTFGLRVKQSHCITFIQGLYSMYAYLVQEIANHVRFC